jgi:hypothetical protein
MTATEATPHLRRPLGTARQQFALIFLQQVRCAHDQAPGSGSGSVQTTSGLRNSFLNIPLAPGSDAAFPRQLLHQPLTAQPWQGPVSPVTRNTTRQINSQNTRIAVEESCPLSTRGASPIPAPHSIPTTNNDLGTPTTCLFVPSSKLPPSRAFLASRAKIWASRPAVATAHAPLLAAFPFPAALVHRRLLRDVESRWPIRAPTLRSIASFGRWSSHYPRSGLCTAVRCCKFLLLQDPLVSFWPPVSLARQAEASE